MERSWLGAESMMQKCDIEEIHLVKKSILKMAFTSCKQGFDKYKNL